MASRNRLYVVLSDVSNVTSFTCRPEHESGVQEWDHALPQDAHMQGATVSSAVRVQSRLHAAMAWLCRMAVGCCQQALMALLCDVRTGCRVLQSHERCSARVASSNLRTTGSPAMNEARTAD